jgi:site-specific DNA-methyltransferase (adenine-specific)
MFEIKKERITLGLDELKQNPKNPKLHNDELIESSINTLGYASEVVVDENNVILAGHGRIKALETVGYTKIDVIRILNWTEEQKEKFLLADNQATLLGGFDMEKLKLFDKDILDFSKMDTDFLVTPDEKDDEIPEAPKVAKSHAGDIYDLGRHRLICGDSTKLEDLVALMDGKKADLYLTDPPYNVNYEGGTKEALKIENDNKTDDDFRQFLRDAFFNANEVMKAGAVFYIWHSDSEGFNFRGACRDVAWQVRQCLIWNKSSMVMGRQDYHWKHEPCLYGWKEGAGHLWASDRKQTTVINFERPTKSTLHPTMKPVELMAYQVMNNTKGEDIVLDSFLGSGSVMIACEKTGRTCYGLELDPKYSDVIVERWCKFTGITEIIKNGKKYHWSISE